VQRLRDETWLRKAGDAARRLAVDRFNRDDLARRLEHSLEDVVADAG
jgi:hypothetical protein